MPDITISLTAPQAQRVQQALEKHLGRPATAQDAKEFLVFKLRQFVQSQEREVAREAIQDAPFDPT